MKARYRKLPVRFEPPARFELTPAPAVPFRGALEDELERLKTRLLAERLEAALNTPEATPLFRRAANEAASLAWLTPCPLLFFPVLFDERTEAALRQAERQARIRLRSQELLAV